MKVTVQLIATSPTSKIKLMFEDDCSHCKNIIVGLGGRVGELFDVQKVTDLVVNNCKSVGQPSSPKFNLIGKPFHAL